MCFIQDASFKSTREILINLSKHFLEGQGDIVRSLHLLGWECCSQQAPLEEFDFSVTNLSTDLRDGIRLCRLVEVLSGDKSIMDVCHSFRFLLDS